MIGIKIAGSILATFIFLSSIKLIPIAINKILPTIETACIISVVKKLEALAASNVIAPWYKSTLTAEKMTPMPRIDAKIIAVIKSNALFMTKIVISPFNPS